VAGLGVRSSTQFRNQFGRYEQVLDQAAIRTVAETADDLEARARAFAPKKTGHLASTIHARPQGKRATVEATAAYAAPQEHGARPHFIPHGLGHDPGVNHPGNPAVHYLLRAIRTIMPKFLTHAEENYPG
jgi:hypothetical protein